MPGVALGACEGCSQCLWLEECLVVWSCAKLCQRQIGSQYGPTSLCQNTY